LIYKDSILKQGDLLVGIEVKVFSYLEIVPVGNFLKKLWSGELLKTFS